MKNAFRNSRQSNSHSDQALLAIFLGLILLTEAMFQAPLLRPVGIIFFSLFLSLILSLQPKVSWPVLPIFWLRASLASLGLVFMLQAVRLGYAEFASNYTSLTSHQLAQACQFLPEHWRVCLQYSKALMEEGRWQEASQLNLARLARYPGFYPSERIAALSAWNQGKKADACAIARRYQQQFQVQNSLHFISLQCGADQSKN